MTLVHELYTMGVLCNGSLPNDFNRKYLLLPSIYNPYCIIKFDGDNHFGYIGFRNFDESFRDEGVDRVVDTWNTP